MHDAFLVHKLNREGSLIVWVHDLELCADARHRSPQTPRTPWVPIIRHMCQSDAVDRSTALVGDALTTEWSGRTREALQCHSGGRYNSPWLLPGAQPEQPLHIHSAHQMMKAAGIPARAARTGTWLQLVREAPPAVLADTLGIHPNTAMRYAKHAGADHLTYAAP